jgi:hypothetical protein
MFLSGTTTSFQPAPKKENKRDNSMSRSRIEYDEYGNEIDGSNEKLFWPVDNGDLFNGSRDALELNSSPSNEDAFFL